MTTPADRGAASLRTHVVGGGRLVVEAEFEGAALALGLPAREAIARCLAGSAGAAASPGRAGTAVVPLPGHEARLHLRPVRHGGLLGPLWRGRVLGLHRPLAELRTTARLWAGGAPVPRPVLVAGWRSGPLWQAVLGTLHLEEARDGVAFLARQPDAATIAFACAAAGTAVRRFHDAGGRHADLHVKNLMLRGRGATIEAIVIDLDRARLGSPPGARRRAAELGRLYRSLRKRRLLAQIGERGLRAFERGYAGSDPALVQEMRRHAARERRRVARHARSYRD